MTGSDAELVRRCRAGDAAAWNELVERFSRYVYAICSQGFRLSDHDAEDVFQDVFTRVYTHLDRLRDDEAFRPWLAQLTRRTCIDRLRSGGRETPVEEVELFRHRRSRVRSRRNSSGSVAIRERPTATGAQSREPPPASSPAASGLIRLAMSHRWIC